MQPSIKKVAILGSGVMGSQIACLFAGIGVEVLLLDIAPKDLPADVPKKMKDKLVNDALAAALKMKPNPIYASSFAKNIQTGNFEDDLPKIATCDWVIEVVVERLDIKKSLYEKVEQYRKKGTFISSNTSSIPIQQLTEGRSEDFKKYFAGTHFFNPPRYLKLLEIIPSKETEQSVIDFYQHYGSLFLGKTVVLCKDTPAFIANRIGVFSIFCIFQLMEEFDFSIDEIEALTGTLIGHPKSATYRTADVVGLDTLAKVNGIVFENCPNDEARDTFKTPEWLNKMLANNWLGDKTKQGFFQKSKSATGDKEIFVLDLKTMQYNPRKKVKLAALESIKPIDSLEKRIVLLHNLPDKIGDFFRKLNYSLFSYAASRLGEISDDIYSIDEAMKAGFGWEMGIFEIWDKVGVEKAVAAMEAAQIPVPAWVKEMLAQGISTFYTLQDHKPYAYNIHTKKYEWIKYFADIIQFSHKKDATVWKNDCSQLYDLGDGVLGLQWNTKMNTIGENVLTAIQSAVQTAEDKGMGLLIANDGPNFSAGANVGMIFMLAIEQDYEELDLAIRYFQNTVMRLRYSSIPVAIAPHGLALGGGCELNLHADKISAAAETYFGLVEAGLGLLPAGGGTKEFVLRASEATHPDIPYINILKERFINIATAKASTSAEEAFGLGILRKGIDEVVINSSRRIKIAKDNLIELMKKGYTQPIQKTDIKVLGRQGLGTLEAGIHGMTMGKYASPHDALVAKKIAYVMCGGDLSEPQLVNEQYLLDLEREAFLSLCGEKKTLQRIESIVKTGKPLRN